MNKFIIISFLCFFNFCSNSVNNNSVIEETKKGNKSKKALVNCQKKPIDFIGFYNKVSNVSLPLSSENFEKYICFTDKKSENIDTIMTDLVYKKLPELISDKNNFISKKKRYAYIKSRPNSEKFNDGVSYEKGNYFYPINKFRKDSVYLITFLYQDFEDIMPSIKTQLNSYNNKGEIIDTLLLDNKFSFEIIYSNDFIINKNLDIKITEKIISYYDKNDELIKKGEKPKTTKTIKEYLLDKHGFFKKKETGN